MRATVSKFGLKPGLRGVRPSLLSVRGADRDVEGVVGVAEVQSEDVGRSEVGARIEARNLSLRSAVAGLSRSMLQCSDRVVAARGLARRAASGVGGACIQGSRLAVGTWHRFRQSGASHAQANRFDILFKAPTRVRDAG